MKHVTDKTFKVKKRAIYHKGDPTLKKEYWNRRTRNCQIVKTKNTTTQQQCCAE
jgi:hypothetical protein